MSLWSKLFGTGEGHAVKVDGARARALVEDGATLLDVRSPEEFSGGHIEGAINIPVGDLARSLEAVPAGPVVVYCRSGVRSARAGRTLLAAGREAVYDLGSIGAW